MDLSALLASLVSVTVLTTEILAQTAENQTTWHELFRDDFDSDHLNTSLWNVANTSGSNEELQLFRSENVYTVNGSLLIQAQKRASSGRNYTSGSVNTSKKFGFLYGEVEWRARVPRGKGLWSALSLTRYECPSTEVPCETRPPMVGVLDFRGDLPRESVSTVFWTQPHAGSIRVADHTIEHTVDLSLDYHVYKLAWRPDTLVWFVDGVQVFNVTGNREIPSVKMQIAMRLAVGGSFAHAPRNRTKFPADFRIDYVLVRQSLNDSAESAAALQRLAMREERPPPKPPRIWVPVVIALSGALIGILLTVGLLCCIRNRRMRARIKALQIPPLFPNIPEPPTLQMSALYNCSSGSDSGHGSNCSTGELTPYFRLLEVPVSKITTTQELLGKGQFGAVWKGLIQQNDSDKAAVVAIKIFHDKEDDQETELQRRLLIEEMKVMTKAGRHLNIVNLLGTVTTGKPMMILEFCPHGSLVKYLQSHRQSFLDSVDMDGALLHSAPSSPVASTGGNACSPGYVSMVSCDSALTQSSGMSSPGDRLRTDDLIHISYQISRGLEYLAGKSIIHRDLAARNILVCENHIVKISDFGLARQRVLADYVLHNDQVALPIKWMAPESIFEKCFSYNSDIWSFGVLMWEIFSLGQTPYPGFTGHVIEFARAVSIGLRMSRPPYAPVFIYEIMCRCWDIDRDLRPTAAVLRAELSTHLTNFTTDYYLQLDEPYQQYNIVNAALLADLEPPALSAES